MKKRLEYIVFLIMLIAVLVTGVLDRGVTGKASDTFNEDDFGKYLNVSTTGGSGPGSGMMKFNCSATNISNFTIKNIVITVFTTEGEQTHNFSSLSAGERRNFEIIVVPLEPGYGKFTQITGFSAKGEIVR